MQVAIFSEGDADEAALRVLADSLLGIQTTPTTVPYRARGWPAVADQLPVVIRSTYFRTDAVGLVVVVDGNGSSLDTASPRNRLRLLREIVEQCAPSGRTDRASLKIAVGVAYPCIEAWWLASRHPGLTESAWEKRTEPTNLPIRKQELKRLLYGTEYPSTKLSTEKMREAAAHAAANIDQLSPRFPFGFSGMVAELRAWRLPT